MQTVVVARAVANAAMLPERGGYDMERTFRSG